MKIRRINLNGTLYELAGSEADKVTMSTPITLNTVDYVTQADGYAVIEAPAVATNSSITLYLNNVAVLRATGNGATKELLSILVRKGAKLKIVETNGTSSVKSFYPLA